MEELLKNMNGVAVIETNLLEETPCSHKAKLSDAIDQLLEGQVAFKLTHDKPHPDFMQSTFTFGAGLD